MSSTNDPLYRSAVEAAAQENGVDPDLLMKIIQQESVGDPHAVSAKGAQGLMQLMPERQQHYGVTDPFDPVQNVNAGTKYFKELLDQYHGDQRLALVHYNGGSKAVDAYKAGKPFKETAGYLKGITGDAVRPDPFDLEGFVKAHDSGPAAEKFDLDGFVKASAPSWTDNALASLKDVGTRLKDAAIETNPITPIVEAAKGFGKRALETSVDLGQLAHRIPGVSSVTGLKPEDFDRPEVRTPLQPTNLQQRIGSGAEQVAEFTIPGMAADEAVVKGASKILPKVIGNPVLRMVANAGELAARGAAQAPVGAAVAGLRGEDPVKAAEHAAIAGSLGPGIVEGVAPALDSAAFRLVRSALKTPISLLNKGGAAAGRTAESKVTDVVNTVRHNRLSTPDAAEQFIKAQEDKLDAPIDAATAAGVTTDAPQRAQQYLRGAQQRLRGVASTPTERMDAFKHEGEALLNDTNGSHGQDVLLPGGTSLQRTGHVVVKVPNPPVLIRELRTNMTPRDTLNSARAADTTWDATRPAAMAQAKKVTEVAERDALKAAVPETAAILEQQGHGIVAKKVLERESVRHGNMDQISLGLMAAHGNPLGIGHQIIRMSGVKGGVMVQQLADALARNDVQTVTNLIQKMGYGYALTGGQP